MYVIIIIMLLFQLVAPDWIYIIFKCICKNIYRIPVKSSLNAFNRKEQILLKYEKVLVQRKRILKS